MFFLLPLLLASAWAQNMPGIPEVEPQNSADLSAVAPQQDLVAEPSGYPTYYVSSIESPSEKKNGYESGYSSYGSGYGSEYGSGYGLGYGSGYGSEHGLRNNGKKGVYDDYQYIGLSYGYGENEPYPKRIGRHGFAFEKRLSRASGLRNPQTPEALEHLGYRLTRKELKYIPLQADFNVVSLS